MKFFKSLRFKLIFFSVLIEVVMLSFLITNSSRVIEQHLTEQATKQLQDIKANFQASLLPLLVVRDYASLDSILSEYTNSKKIVYVFIKKDGQIIATSNWDKTQLVPNTNIPFNTEEQVYNTKTDIVYLDQSYGEVYFGLDTTFLQTAKDEIVTQSLFIAFFEILLSVILLFSIGYFLTKNLSLLTDAAENISNNNLDIRLKIETNDELGLLAKTFNKMVVQITNNLSVIQAQNDVQKELIKSLDNEMKSVKTILENAGDPIHILDFDGNVFMYSDSFRKSLGYTKEEVLKLNVSDWDKDFNPQEIRNLMKEFQTFETIHTRKDGTSFPVEISTTGVVLNDRTYLYAASRDITERKISQEQLRQKDMLLYQQSKMASMGEMIGNIAHQWRQPLSVISTSVTGLGIKMEVGMEVEEKEVIENLNRVNDTVQFLSKTIDDFQDYLKPQQHNQEFNIKNVITKNLEMFGKAFSNNDIEIILDMEDVIINNSQNELLQVAINILNNAKDALKECRDENRKIFIVTYKDDDNAILSIKDNAGGIPDEVLPNIFDAYFTTKHKSQGTGLGLYMSYQIITNRFGGTIEALNEEYEYQGEHYIGANFKIIIPLSS
ncbi:MAG: ATP-binding protein [Arcobacteraceae bacterium]|nr:ATP-binding protein [Arcobacteraceae bacterium]